MLIECEDCGWKGCRNECFHEYAGQEPLIVDGFTVMEDTYEEVCPICYSRNLVDEYKSRKLVLRISGTIKQVLTALNLLGLNKTIGEIIKEGENDT